MEGDLTGYISVKENQGQMAKGCSKFDLGTLNVFHLTDCGDGGDDLSQLELVEDCCFSGCVQSNHQDPHLLLSEEALEQGGEHVTHGDVAVPLVWAQLVRICKNIKQSVNELGPTSKQGNRNRCGLQEASHKCHGGGWRLMWWPTLSGR